MIQERYHPVPQPEDISTREKEDAMGAYLMMFAAIGAGLPLPIINMLAAIIYYYINKHKSLFVRFHALQSLFSQIPVSILNAIAVIWAIRILFFNLPFSDIYKGYLIMVVIANIIYFIFSIIGALKSRKGRMYYFLFFGPLSYKMAFKVREEKSETILNIPPKL